MQGARRPWFIYGPLLDAGRFAGYLKNRPTLSGSFNGELQNIDAKFRGIG